MKQVHFETPIAPGLPDDFESQCASLVNDKQGDYRDYLDVEYLNCGKYSDIYRTGNYVVKLSTLNTGAGTMRGAENLIHQGTFLHGLNKFVEREDVSDVRAPAQYFAMQSGNRGLLVQEFMESWTTAREKYGQKPLDDQIEVCVNYKERIENLAKQLPALMGLGLDDLRGDGYRIHMSNILVRPDSDLPATDEPLRIIDQSGGNGPKSWLASKAASQIIKA